MDYNTKQAIIEGKTVLGIELGSTRIKAMLIGEDYVPIASGEHDWENRFDDGMWTYTLEDVWSGLQDSFRKLAGNVRARYGVPLKNIRAMGVSAMMHGYLVFDKDGSQLVPFRTWRNTITEDAAATLTEAFQFNIPQRWSVAHLYRAITENEPHVKDIAFITTLAGFVHWRLTGKKVVGVGEASGMFPIDSAVNDYNAAMLEKFDEMVADKELGWKIKDILPKVLDAGEGAGTLTVEGATLLDPSGILAAGAIMCPPEGDAGTGMAATGSVSERTGNVSAGTSIFAMIVLEKPLSRVYPEIDMVTTPAGKPVAMVHCNNCTTDLDAWAKMFAQLLEAVGANVSKAALYDELYFAALKGENDGGGLMAYNYHAGEPITGLEAGRLLVVRSPDDEFTLANFMRTMIYSTMATLRLGMDILTENEQVRLTQLMGHGGLFKTEGVGQRLMAGALNVPVAVMDSAGEGGAWGIALLAMYLANRDEGENLEEYLAGRVFSRNQSVRMEPLQADVEGFEVFMEKYKKGLAVERAAVENL